MKVPTFTTGSYRSIPRCSYPSRPEIKLFAGWFRYKYLMTWFYSEVMWDHRECTEISHDITNFQLLISPQLAGNAWFGHWDALLLHGLPSRSINLQFHPLQVAVSGVGSGWWVKSSLLVRIRREVFSVVTPRKPQLLVFLTVFYGWVCTAWFYRDFRKPW